MKQSPLFNHIVLISLILSQCWHPRAYPMAGASLLTRLPDMVQAAQTLSLAMATAITYYHQRSHVAQALHEHTSTIRTAHTGIRHEQIPLFPSVKAVESYQSSHSIVSHTASQASGQQLHKEKNVDTPSLHCPDFDTVDNYDSSEANLSSTPQEHSPLSKTSLASAYAALFSPDNLKTHFPSLTPHYIPPSFCERTSLQPYWEARLVNRQLSPLEQDVDSLCQQSANNLMLVHYNKAYAENVGQRLIDFFHLLCATHHTDLLVRIKSRLLLPYCVMEPPWGTCLIDAAYGLMCEYFTPTGALKSTVQSDNALPSIRYFLDHITVEEQREWRAQKYGLTTLVQNGTQRTLWQQLGWNIGTFFTYPHFRVMQQRIAAHQENIQLLEFIDLCQKGDIWTVLPHYYTLNLTQPIIQEIFHYYFGKNYDADGLLRTVDPYYTALTQQDRAILKSDRAQLTSFNHLLHLRMLCVKTMQQRWNLNEEHARVLYELLDDQGTILHDTNLLLERVEQRCAQDTTLLPLFYMPNGVLKDLQSIPRVQTLPSCIALLQNYNLSSLRILLNKAIIAEYEQHNEAAIHFLDTISLTPDTLLTQLQQACSTGSIELPKSDNIPPSDVVPQLDPPPRGDDLIGIIIPPITQPPAIPELPQPQCGAGSELPKPKISETCPTARRRGLPPLSGEQERDSTVGNGDQSPNPECPSSSVEPPHEPDWNAGGMIISNPEQKDMVEDDSKQEASLITTLPEPLVNEKDLSPDEMRIYEWLKELKKQYPDIATQCPSEEIVQEIKDLIRELYEEYIKNYDPTERLSLEKIALLLNVEEKDLYKFYPYMIGFEHIFNIDYWKNAKGEAQIGGWHLDHKNILRGSGIIEVEIIKDLPNRCKKVRIKWLGDSKESTLVPPDWNFAKYIATLEKIVKCNAKKARLNWNNTQLIVHGYSEELIPFKIVFTDKGQLKTAYPDFDWENNASNNSP